MEIEEALERQRLRLLRHLAWLVALVAFMSFGPHGDRLPRWVRKLVMYLLRPAEDAANCLVDVMVCLIANGRITKTAQQNASFFPDNSDLYFSGDDPVQSEVIPYANDAQSICVETLLSRLEALRDKLEDLTGHALQRMRKRTDRRKRPAKAKRFNWAVIPNKLNLNNNVNGFGLLAIQSPFAPP